jgi:hypothetical protein
MIAKCSCIFEDQWRSKTGEVLALLTDVTRRLSTLERNTFAGYLVVSLAIRSDAEGEANAVALE